MSITSILFITLSNIGDVILTVPALERLHERFPSAKVTVLVGKRAASLLAPGDWISEVIPYDKRARLREKIRLWMELRRRGFDMVVDLRNSFFGFLPARVRLGKAALRRARHKLGEHLAAVSPGAASEKRPPACVLLPDERTRRKAALLLKEGGLQAGDCLVVFAPGARSSTKRWEKERFVALLDTLLSEGVGEGLVQPQRLRFVIIGDEEDAQTASWIAEHAKAPVCNLCGRTNLAEAGQILRQADLVVTNDSALMHLASYWDRPVVALFGPTDEARYGPWSRSSAAVSRDIFCRPCSRAQCRFKTRECLALIGVSAVTDAIRRVLSPAPRQERALPALRRILVVRTDRIGDVVLSTPVLQALRGAYPNAYCAVMVGPAARDVVEGNPFVDEVLVYDKDGSHRGWLASMRFALSLRRRRFDAAFILHPTNRVHLIVFFAGIRLRFGYNRKLGFLLNRRLAHAKHLGEKHELDYNLDVVERAGLTRERPPLYMPFSPAAEEWARQVLEGAGIGPGERVLALHPGASCRSKRWPAERFAEAAEALMRTYRLKTVIVGGRQDAASAAGIAGRLGPGALNLCGRTSVAQLASVLRRCALLISNDSGPVHVASAVNTPVVSIFGRKQPGLSPRRWGPLNRHDRFVHRDAGCVECRAHDCTKGWVCLDAVSVSDVLKAAQEALEGRGP